MNKRIFISYSHADADRLERLHKHLAQLKREGSIEAWYDREITAGGRLDDEILSELTIADIFLAIMSPDFIASNYCYDVELKGALKREERGELVIVPVIFEPCDWLATDLKKFKALPEDGKPVSQFANENVALLGITSELRRISSSSKPKIVQPESFAGTSEAEHSVNSRYRIRREFDKVDKRDFINKSYVEIRAFFAASSAEINQIPEIDADFREVDRDSFACTVTNRGMGRAYETVTVRKGASFGDIDLIYGERPASNTSNGGFYVQSDEYQMFLSGSSFGMGRSQSEKLSANEAAKQIWDDLLRKVGVDYA